MIIRRTTTTEFVVAAGLTLGELRRVVGHLTIYPDDTVIGMQVGGDPVNSITFLHHNDEGDDSRVQ